MPALRTRDTQSRPLEVTTDAPAAPSLHIVSPTPRAFTFPISHNLSDSPYASPSSSPFEPDLRSLPHPCTLSSSSSSMTATPPPHPYAILRADSPFARAPSPPTPAHTTHKRRKSSCSSDVVERRPKKGDEDYIKRPENAFILFRRKCCEDRQQAQEEAAANADATGAGPTKKQRQADLSKTISQQWKSLSPEERQFWEQLAKDKKKEHESKYPNYVYRPQRAKDKDGKTKSNNTSKKASSTAAAAASAAAAHAQAQAEAASKAMGYDESDSVSFVVPVSRPHGRSASAPTPPPYQSIQIPNVYHLTPSCPTSPSLLPMISRRSAHPGHPEDTFDFVATNQSAYLPSSYPMAGQFEASLQSSEFLRSMFNNPNTAANGHRNSEPATHLQHLNMSQQPDTLLLPAHPIVSPASSIGSGSGSSGPSSPSCGPYTPTSALLSSSSSSSSASSWHHMPSSMGACDPTSLEAQAQAEMDLQTEMQMQQEFAAFAWGGGPNALWGTGEPAVLMGDDFDINAIPPIELGVPKYTENLAMGAPDGSGLEFGQDFVHALDAGSQYHHHEHQGMSGLLFDDMMAGHGF